jgi:murein DD-endopeptidase MepM/ murein hydrolase activator NlpD/pSer/pThr/pTyr-binding forkhead associated (FHA) protein
MNRPSSQATLRVERNGRTVRSIPLGSGALVVGRDPECDLQLDDRMISRRHCEIRVEGGRVTVTDLDSRNGVQLGERRLGPQEPASWTPDVPVRLGPFVLHLQGPAPSPEPSTSATWRVASDQATPSVLVVGDRPIVLGRDPECDMVFTDPRISRRQCEIRSQNGQLWVTDLSGRNSTRLGDSVLQRGRAEIWPAGVLLNVGPFPVVHTTDAPAAAPEPQPVSPPVTLEPEPVSSPAVMSGPIPETTVRPAIERQMWRAWIRQLPWLPIAIVAGGICLLLGVSVGVVRLVMDARATPEPSLVPSPVPAVAEATATPLPSATPLPTEITTGTPVPTQADLMALLETATPLPTVVCTPQLAGWLDLPFPYDDEKKGFGNAEQFRQASQRSVSGGRINSFFDHEYPLYRAREQQFGGAGVLDTLVLFDGSRSSDKWLYPDRVGDYYSGHPGIDYSTQEWGKATTPVLAPADGTFLGAGTDSLGNNYVLIKHDRGAEGVYQTSYLHLENDEYFFKMRDLAVGTPIQAGDQIGTMGNTGNSFGHHLHFEVRRDCNGDGAFTLDEAVDPYGFIVSPEFPADPLAQLTCGGSEYLWKYTLVASEEGGICAEPSRQWQLDPAPFHGYISLSTFFFNATDPTASTRVRIWLGQAQAAKLEDIGSIRVHRYDPATSTWQVVDGEKKRFVENKVLVEVELSQSGKYSVTGKPLQDIIPPTTTIELTGLQQDGRFLGTVVATLSGEDEGPEDSRGVNRILYSLDCGQTWETYPDRPLVLSPDDLEFCYRAEDSENVERGLEEDEYVILAAAVDWSNNYEQPPNQQRFKLVADDSSN